MAQSDSRHRFSCRISGDIAGRIEDAELFAPAWHAALREAVGDLSWLLTRGYAPVSALKVVGDRYNLSARQRVAVMRSGCRDAALTSRRSRELAARAVAGRRVLVDGSGTASLPCKLYRRIMARVQNTL